MRPLCKHYAKEFGEEIPSAYLESFTEHDLALSRYKSSIHVKRCGGYSGLRRALFEVKDGKYLAKLMGVDSPLYGGDAELTFLNKISKTPFDLLRGEVTANLVDLWCEYAIATKKIPCFTFSQGLKAEVDSYFDLQNNATLFSSQILETEKLVVSLQSEDYRWLYRHFLIGELSDLASQGVDVVKNWLKESFNIKFIESLPMPNDADKDLNVVGSGDVSRVTSLVKEVAVAAWDKVREVSRTLGQTFSVGSELSIENKAPP